MNGQLTTFSGFVAGISASMLIYGSLVESNRLVVKKHDLQLKDWPNSLSGFKIALISDLHLTNHFTIKPVHQAASIIADLSPNMVVIAGDFVSFWKPESPVYLHQALKPLKQLQGNIVAIPGNHDYLGSHPSQLPLICEELGIKLLRNENWNAKGINWVGIDSICVKRSNPFSAMHQVQNGDPLIALWHEPDLVFWLPKGASLMLSGHTHGGQFIFPGGFAPASTRFGRHYRKGFFPDAPTPLFVTSGIGTTGPPSRFLCPPEVVLLSLYSEPKPSLHQ